MVMTSGTDGAKKVTTILGTEEGYSCRKISPRLPQISLFMLFSVFSGAAAFDSIKNFRVIIGISKSCFFCHKVYGFAGVQVLQASLDTIFLKKGKKGRIHMSFE